MPWRQSRYKLTQLAIALVGLLDHFCQNILDFANNRQIHANIFLDRCRVNINMDNFCVWSKSREFTGYSIIKAGSDSNDKVTVSHRHIGTISTMHTEHAE